MRNCIESLEQRRFLSAGGAVLSGSTLVVRGSSTEANTISVSAVDANGSVTVTVNGESKQFDAARIRLLRIVGGARVINGVTTSLAVRTRVDGGRLADTIRVTDKLATVFGGAGNDTLIATPSDRGTGAATGAAAAGVYFRGGAGDDTLTGGNGNDRLYGEAGNDFIQTGGGKTYLDAGPGNDSVALGSGTCSANLNTGNDSVTGGNGGNDIRCGTGDDVVTIGSDTSTRGDTVRGQAGKDSITGGAGDDHFSGGPGDDTVRGNGGDDSLGASTGRNDVLDGGTGSNRLFGGRSHARMTASPQSDSERNTYEINSRSVIEPAARKGIDRVYRFVVKSNSDSFFGGFFPF